MEDTKPSMSDYKSVMGAVYGVDPELIETLLWEETAFPACGIRHVTKQLVDYFENHATVTTAAFEHPNTTTETEKNALDAPAAQLEGSRDE